MSAESVAPLPGDERGSAIEAVFRRAADAGRLVWLTEPNGRYRVVEPYAVYISGTGKRLLHLYQVGGYSAGAELRGWKNIEVSTFDSVQLLETRFAPREAYNPFNESVFPTLIHARPTADGRVRPPDEG